MEWALPVTTWYSSTIQHCPDSVMVNEFALSLPSLKGMCGNTLMVALNYIHIISLLLLTSHLPNCFFAQASWETMENSKLSSRNEGNSGTIVFRTKFSLAFHRSTSSAKARICPVICMWTKMLWDSPVITIGAMKSWIVPCQNNLWKNIGIPKEENEPQAPQHAIKDRLCVKWLKIRWQQRTTWTLLLENWASQLDMHQL